MLHVLKKAAAAASFFALLAPVSSYAVLQKGQPAPPLKVTTLSGQNVTLANYKGYVLLVDFFATWCPPCKEAVPELVSLGGKYRKQGLQILGLSLDEGGVKQVRDFAAEKKINYPVALVGDDLTVSYGVRSLPTLFLINKKGVVVEKFQGFSDETGKAIETAVKKLLAE